MDPVAAAVTGFQEEFRAFLGDERLRVFWVATDPQSLATLQQTLRGEEWSPENRSPFLVFTEAHTRGGGALDAMTARLRQHFGMLREGLEKDGTALPAFGEVEAGSSFGLFLRSLARWIERTASVLDPPVVCWIPVEVEDGADYAEYVRGLLEHAPHPRVRFVVGDTIGALHLRSVFELLEIPGASTTFRLDPDLMLAWFKGSVLAPSPKGRAAGAPPGAAAPDVEPPRRPGPQPPTDEEVREILESEGLPPVLTPGDADRLQRLVFEAAGAVGEGDAAQALRKQHEAYELCGEAGVTLEQGMMALVLAGYLVQFERAREAAEWYRQASALALAADAPAQASQALMGLGYVYFQAGDYPNAASIYRDAAERATEADVPLLTLEHLRMAGLSLHAAGQPEGALDSWIQALAVARAMKPGELAASGYPDMLGHLHRVVESHGTREQAGWVEGVAREIVRRQEEAVAEQGAERPATASSAGQRAEEELGASS